MSTTAFIADVTEFQFYPEKYAQDQSEVVAELRLPVLKDWMHIIELWFQSRIGRRFKDLMINASATTLRFGDSARDATYTVSDADKLRYGFVASDTVTYKNLNDIDLAITKTLLYCICAFTGLYSGHAYVHSKQEASGAGAVAADIVSTVDGHVFWKVMTKTLQSLITLQRDLTQNELEIDGNKVHYDLSADASGNVHHALTPSGFTAHQVLWTDRPIEYANRPAEVGGNYLNVTDSNFVSGTNFDPFDPTDNNTITQHSSDTDVQEATTNDDIISKINGLWSNVHTTVTPDVLIAGISTGPAIHVASYLNGDSNGVTNVLSQVFNAEAFLPVFNRLIHGGNFFVNFADGYGEYSSSANSFSKKRRERKFNPYRQFKYYADASATSAAYMKRLGDTEANIIPPPLIPYESELVFPVQITIADKSGYTSGVNPADDYDYSRAMDQPRNSLIGLDGSQNTASQALDNAVAENVATQGGHITSIAPAVLSGIAADASRTPGYYSNVSGTVTPTGQRATTAGNIYGNPVVNATFNIVVEQDGSIDVSKIQIVRRGARFVSGDTITFTAFAGGNDLILAVSGVNDVIDQTTGAGTEEGAMGDLSPSEAMIRATNVSSLTGALTVTALKFNLLISIRAPGPDAMLPINYRSSAYKNTVADPVPSTA